MAMLVEFSAWPMGKGESVSEYVAESLEIIDRSGIPYQLNPMSTVLEGEWDEIMPVVRECFDRMSRESDRIHCTFKIDWRRGETGRLSSKVEKVEQRLGKKLHTCIHE